jgi:RNA polymerase sigma factor (sigma-70 family)
VEEISIHKKIDVQSNVDLAEKIFEEHGDFIRSVIRFNIQNAAEAEDLFQDFFLFLISKPVPKEVQNLRGFLYKAVSDKVNDASRRINRYQAKICRYAERSRRIIENSPEKAVIEIEETKKMFKLIQRRLPNNEARAVMLRYRNNRDIGEVAVKMGIKPRSVSRYVSAGLKRIRQVFDVNKGNSYDNF